MIRITHDGELLAIIVPAGYAAPGVNFATEGSLSQQLAVMSHPKGKVIEPHTHNAVQREVHFTQEALFLRKGALRVDLYDGRRNYLESRVLRAGDVILLVGGGHGFEVLEDIEMVEIKQGPYTGERDKTRFEPVSAARVRVRDDA